MARIWDFVPRAEVELEELSSLRDKLCSELDLCSSDQGVEMGAEERLRYITCNMELMRVLDKKEKLENEMEALCDLFNTDTIGLVNKCATARDTPPR